MLRISSSIAAVEKRTGFDRKRLENDRIRLTELRDFNKQLKREIESDDGKSGIYFVAGMVAYAVGIMTDAIMDCVSGVPDGGLEGEVIDRVYQVGTRRKFEGNKHGSEIKNIGIAQDALEVVLPPGTKFLARVFANLAKNTVGMIGYAEDSAETKQMLRQSLQQMRDNLDRLERQIERIDHELKRAAEVSPNKYQSPNVILQRF